MTKHSEFNELYKAILSLKTEQDCRAFFEDICTIKELETMSQRLEVARMLIGGATFNEIVAATGASTTTISRVNRCLNYGDGGYKTVIEKMQNA